MVRRSCGSLGRDGAGTDRGGEIIACRGVRTGNRGLRQGRAHALRAAAERRILQTPRQGEEQQDQCQLNSLLHPVRIINFYAAKIHSFTQKNTSANQNDHKMTNFDYKSMNPRPAKNAVSYIGNGIRTPGGKPPIFQRIGRPRPSSRRRPRGPRRHRRGGSGSRCNTHAPRRRSPAAASCRDAWGCRRSAR